jgi:redox-regulated HSP33 family molecular chaperone
MVATTKYLVARMRAVWQEIKAQPTAELFTDGACNPLLKMTLDGVKVKLDTNVYEKTPIAFVDDMHLVFSCDSEGEHSAAALNMLTSSETEDLVHLMHKLRATRLTQSFVSYGGW